MKNTVTPKLISSLRSGFALLLLVTLLQSCDNFTETGLPPGQLASAAVFEDKSTATAAMLDIYAKLRDVGILSGIPTGLSSQLGSYADELDFYGEATNGTRLFYNNALVASNTDVSDWWANSYNGIYAANSVIEGLAASENIKSEDKAALTGEALFVRALLHFYLVNLYGGVPYIDTTDYRLNQVAARQSEDAVYLKIIADLERAIDYLPDTEFPSRTRPDRAAAAALLARVYLYHGDWAEASNAASAVLNTGNYLMEDDIDNVFLKDSPSTIWQLSPQGDGINTNEGVTFIFNSGPPPFVALTNALLDAFEPGDLRRSHWIATVTGDSGVWFHANKYKEQTNTDSSLEYSIILRVAEQYLIRAEARAQQGELIGAIEDLNMVRNHAGLGNTTANGKEQLLDAIQRERRAEFFTEQGHRFFDLKRTGTIDAALSFKPGWNATDKLLPIPEADLLMNANLAPQNPGY